MDTRELVKLVEEMRVQQRRWFGGDKSSHTFAECKRLERAVDKAVAEVLDDRPSLFDREGGAR
jgi:hypothetical protein